MIHESIAINAKRSMTGQLCMSCLTGVLWAVKRRKWHLLILPMLCCVIDAVKHPGWNFLGSLKQRMAKQRKINYGGKC